MIRGTTLLLGLALMISGCGGSEGGLPGRLRSVVFDIDGTLTVNQALFFVARKDAARAVELYVDKGYAVIFLSARPDFLEQMTRSFLQANGFPDLPLYMADTILTDDDQTLAYKAGTLLRLIEEEQRVFLYGYGDSTTDFEAYNESGIPVDHTFALLRLGEGDCQPGLYESCLSGYTDHLPYIEEQHNVN